MRAALLGMLLLPALAGGAPGVRPAPMLDRDDRSLVHIRNVVLRDGVRFTGVLVARDARRMLVASTEYRDGVRDGWSEAWYANGRLSYQRLYRADREEGAHTGWWEDGRLHFVYHYHRGLIEGVAREWFPDGRLYREFHYRAGQESGSERMWYSGGGLRANYVVRDGRRFGLPGTKGCTGLDSTLVLP